MKITLSIIIVSIFLISNVHAQPVTYQCDYPSWSDEEGNHNEKNNFSITFLVDEAANKAYMVGILGASEVFMQAAEGQISFIETTISGNLMTTTIAQDNTTVHSRNSVVLGELVPSQYYGKCVIR